MLISVLSFIVGLTGAGLLSAGAWLISPSVGLITGGIICLGWSYMTTRAFSSGVSNGGGI